MLDFGINIMTDYDKLRLEYARLIGESIGGLKAFLWWDIPEKLREKINNRLKELEIREQNFIKNHESSNI